VDAGGLLTAGGRHIAIWRLPVLKITVSEPVHDDLIRGAILSPTRQYALSWATDNQLCLMDVREGISVVRKGSMCVVSGCFAEEGRSILALTVDPSALEGGSMSSGPPSPIEERFAKTLVKIDLESGQIVWSRPVDGNPQHLQAHHAVLGAGIAEGRAALYRWSLQDGALIDQQSHPEDCGKYEQLVFGIQSLSERIGVLSTRGLRWFTISSEVD